jgi:hypothetical protein
MNATLIGKIQQLQIQQSRLKVGEGESRYYHTAPILPIAALRLTPAGVIGLLDKVEYLDVHHQDHPETRNGFQRGKFNGVSINFSSHYRRMGSQFGNSDEVGYAGENILVESEDAFSQEALAAGLIIENSKGQRIILSQVSVAAPCVPFSKYMLAESGPVAAEVIRDTLQFLDKGTRGFYCHWEGKPIVIRVGDKVYLKTEAGH